MPKVEFEKIRLAVTAISKDIVATIPNKEGNIMLHKHDVTCDFLQCIIDFGANSRWNIVGGDANDKKYEVACLEKKGYKRAIYSRKEVIELMADAIKDNITAQTLEDWIFKNLQ